MTVTVKQLRAARERIKRGWTQMWFARDARGHPVPVGDQNAVCWCTLGALQAETFPHLDEAIALRGHLPLGPWGDVIVVWNDTPGRSQADVIALYDRAIAAAEQAA